MGRKKQNHFFAFVAKILILEHQSKPHMNLTNVVKEVKVSTEVCIDVLESISEL